MMKMKGLGFATVWDWLWREKQYLENEMKKK